MGLEGIKVVATREDGSEHELHVRHLEVGEIVAAPHRQIIHGLEYYEDPKTRRRFPNDDCEGIVTVRGPIPFHENLTSECLIGCASCEYVRVDDAYVLAEQNK